MPKTIIALTALVAAALAPGNAAADETRTVRGVDKGRSLQGRGEACSKALLNAYRGHCWTDKKERLVGVRFPNLAGGSACTCNTPAPGAAWICEVQYENECAQGPGPRASFESYFDTTRAAACTEARALAARNTCPAPTPIRADLKTSPCHCEQHKSKGTWQCFVSRLESCRARPVAPIRRAKAARAPTARAPRRGPPGPNSSPSAGKPMVNIRLGLVAGTNEVDDDRGYLIGLGADLSMFYWFNHRVGQELHAAARFAGGFGTFGGAELDGTTWFRRLVGARVGVVSQTATANNDADPEIAARKNAPLFGVAAAAVLRPRTTAVLGAGHAGGLFVDLRFEHESWSVHAIHRRYSDSGVEASATVIMIGRRGWRGYKRSSRRP